jgi:glycosyltransferase involved in cell wall biosynthesis
MIRKKSVAVIVPAYNEENFINKSVLEIPDGVDKIICVDDKSTDGTYEMMLNLAKSDKRITVIQSPTNGGFGKSTKLGITNVLSTVDYVAVLPGDNQCDANLIKKFIEICEDQGYDCCKGNRFLGANDTTSMPTNRKIGNLIYSYIMKVVSGYYTIFDSQHGFCAFRTQKIVTDDLRHIRDDYLFDNSMWILFNTKNATIAEIASPVRYQGEISDINYINFVVRSIKYMTQAILWRLYMKYGLEKMLVALLGIFIYLLTIDKIIDRGILFLHILIIVLWLIFYDYCHDPNKRTKMSSR